MSSASGVSANTISGQIKWTGLGSDTDFASVVEVLVAQEQRVITRQETWKSQWQAKLEAITQLDVRLGSLKLDAQSNDTREELLSRTAASSNESVASVSNTSTAAVGTYAVEVGENIAEIIASKTYGDAKAIGGGEARDKDGNILDPNGNILGTHDVEDDNIIAAVEDYLGLAAGDLTYDSVNREYLDAASVAVARVDAAGDNIFKLDASGNEVSPILTTDPNGYFTTVSDHRIIPKNNPDPALDYYFPPLTITMGGQTLTLDYSEDPALLAELSDPARDEGDPFAALGVYSKNMTMAQLADMINQTIADKKTQGLDYPDVRAEVVYDKTRGGAAESRLRIIGNVGGKDNHIIVSDPTDLGLDKNSIDAVVNSSWVMSGDTQAYVTADSEYTGNVNKNITFVVSNSAVIGEDDIEIAWADTEGKSGKIILKASDWDAVNKRFKEDFEIEQGLKINFDYGSLGRLAKADAFTIDLQTPVLQKAADIGLAQTDKWVHKGFADLTSPVTYGQSGTFVYSYAGKEYSVGVRDTAGLSALVEAINNDSNNPGVTASILNDGMGTATSYKLVLTGGQTGQENAIRISDKTNLNRMDCKPEDFSHAREASNSMSRIDGYPDDGDSWIQRSSNEVGDVLDGVVISLNGVGETLITIKNDVQAMADKIKQLVSSANFCKSYIKEQTKFGGGKLVSKVLSDGTFTRETEATEDGSESSGVMIGNYGFQISQSEIDRLMTGEIFTQAQYFEMIDPQGQKYGNLPAKDKKDMFDQYLEENGLIYTRLSDIGIASNHEQQGQYIIEETKLTEALTKNPEAVIKLFTFKPDESMPLKTVYEDEDARPMISGWAVQMGYKMSDLTRTTDVINDKTGEVIRPGKGITKVLADNYNSIIGGIDNKISREERRISMVRQRLTDKFARLEVALSTLNQQSETISSQLAKLTSSSSSS